MSRIDIGSSVFPENVSGKTRGFAGVVAACETPVFTLVPAGVAAGFAVAGSFIALSHLALSGSTAFVFGARIPSSTMTCALAVVASVEATNTTATTIFRMGTLRVDLFSQSWRYIREIDLEIRWQRTVGLAWPRPCKRTDSGRRHDAVVIA